MSEQTTVYDQLAVDKLNHLARIAGTGAAYLLHGGDARVTPDGAWFRQSCGIDNVAPHLKDLAAARHIRDSADDTLRYLVDAHKANGATWRAIGYALGVSPQAAQQRYGR